jgi:transposase
MLHQSPHQEGHVQARWTLRALLDSCPWLRLTTLGGLSRLLLRLGIRRKRARAYLHSPDPDYGAKVAYLQQCWQQVQADPVRYVLLYLDEFAFERQPSLSVAYAARGSKTPLAHWSYRTNTQCRGLGALNALTGQLTYCQHSKITTSVLSAFYAQLRQAYPQAEVIYVVQDNWPVHVHPNVLARLQPQRSPFWPHVPDNWPLQPSPRAVQGSLPIQMVFLPTYAPWLNPIEKLWRWLRQDILHLHRLSDAWPALKQRVLDFMASFALGSQALLHYVGLLPY